ncbi:Histocompatibility 2, M region locus 11 [Apodemus speciosus]|uniref:Histocompatibility 2, M region locus 11 n=1 Tax=Apodemus speciosus TaxID=105296 RepID=A0ABQ0FPN9_APOSI
MKNFESQLLLLMLMVTFATTKHSKGMKTFVTEALLLLLSALLALTSHGEDVGFVDDIQFERFNSRRNVQRTEHCAPWIDQKKPEYWKHITNLVLSYFQEFTEVLQSMLEIYNYSATGYHTLQRRYGCYVLPRGYFSHGFFELAINEHDYIRLNEDRRSWTPVGKFAKILRKQWATSDFTKIVRDYLEYQCVDTLLTELEYGKEILLTTDTPKLHVTRKVRPNKKITLRCWALNFYPAEITLIWKRDESNQTAHTEVSETRPSGDGTFQKWAAVVVHSGEEHRYTCHVNHKGLPEPMTLRWEPPETTVPFMPIVIAGILGALLMGAVMIFLIWKRKTRG